MGTLYIHEGTHDPVIRRFAYDYVTDDVIPVLDTPEHPCPLNLPKYRDVVLERFGNPAIRDTNQRVAMDGFSKIPGFIAPTFRQRLARGETIDSVAMLPALFLAYLHAQRLAEVLPAASLIARTPHTLTSFAKLKREVELTRTRGFSLDDEEYHPGVRCVAAPVFGSDGQVVAAIGITASMVRFTPERLPEMAGKVKTAAAELSALLGYTGTAA